MLLWLPLLNFAQSKLPVIKASSKNLKIRDGQFLKEDFWVLVPEAKPDVYFVDFPRKDHPVTFITDQDSIRFEVKFGQHYDFIVLLNGKDSCHIRISATDPKSVVRTRSVPIDSIPFTMTDNRIYVQAKLNGSEDIRFQFDLGAGGIGMCFLNHRSVKKVKLNFDKTTTLGNSDGMNQARMSTANTLQIGNTEWQQIEVVETKNMNRYEDGLFGNGLFLDKYVEVNYEKKMLIIHDKLPTISEGYKKFPLRFNQSVCPEIEATFELEGKKHTAWFVFDTGMTGNAIVSDYFLKKHNIYHKFSKILFPIAGRAIAKMPLIHLADHTFSQGLVVLETDSRANHHNSDAGGVVGNKLLKKFNFILDSHQGFIYMKPNFFFEEPDHELRNIIFAGVGIFLALSLLVFWVVKKIRTRPNGSGGRLLGAQKIATILLILGNFSCSHETLPDLDTSLTTDFLIESKEKNKTYRIWVQLPEGYQNTGQSYATLYVLDPDDASVAGNSNFFYIAKKCQRLSQSLGTKGVIVVGIRLGDYREVDYTPTKFNTTGFSGEGGGEAFMNFVKRELIPRIEKDYRAAPIREQRGIIGHSLGGLCGAYAFAKHNEAFGNYLLLSPSLMYDDEIVLQYEQQTRNDIKNRPQLVYLGVGGTEANMVPATEIFYNRLLKNYPKAKTVLHIIPGKGHNSSKDENLKYALHFYFNNKTP
jgi:predicted alpha/beta superfamily hydrolase